MIRVPFDPRRLDGQLAAWWSDWIARAERALARAAAAVTNGEAPNVNGHAQVWRECKAWFVEHVFWHKCAYCEGPLDAQTAGVTEHWRPKLGVRQLDGAGSALLVTRPDGSPHRGYWWLAFQWENLVPACERCNTPKGTLFPISGTRVFEHGVASDVDELDRNEEPLLLHPFRGPDPAAHIAFDAAGRAFAREGSDLAEHTIRVCDLNRWGLVRERARRQRDAIDKLALALSDHVRHGASVDRRMRDVDGPHAVYSSAVRDALTTVEATSVEQLLRRAPAAATEPPPA